MQINGFVLDAPVKHPLLVALAVLVFAESALMAVATIYLVVEIIIDTPTSYASAVGLIVLTAIATIWLSIIAVNILRGRAWTRAATITWQVLQIAVAVGCFQGYFARPDIGWVLLVPSVIGILLAFTPPVVAATAKRD